MNTHPIDAVITWVDGNDPKLAAKRQKFQPDFTIPGVEMTRFASCNEILYCVVSILKFAPFFRNIFIVTDAQTPPIFEIIKRDFPDQFHKIKMVDHKDIFRGYEDCLPCFNSTSIISMLHHIEGLSEHYVYFNDDMMLVRPIKPDAFFVDEMPVQYGGWLGRALPLFEWAKTRFYDIMRIEKERRTISYNRRHLTAARLAGFSAKTFISTHAPYAMRKSTLHKFENKNRNLWHQNAKHRFRVQEQFPAESLAAHLEFKNNTAIEKDRFELIYIRKINNFSKTKKKLKKAEISPKIKFICIQNLDLAQNEILLTIKDWLDCNILKAAP